MARFNLFFFFNLLYPKIFKDFDDLFNDDLYLKAFKLYFGKLLIYTYLV